MTTDYDQLTYVSNPIPESSISRLAAYASFYGAQAVPPQNSRVLEIACASGNNLIPLAARYPSAFFEGIDLSVNQIKAGQDFLRKLPFQNIRLKQQDIFTYKEQQEFDYIIIHGLYSWISAADQYRLLEKCQSLLSEYGVLYISYNVLPGWKLGSSLRESFFRKNEEYTSVLAKVNSFREYLNSKNARNDLTSFDQSEVDRLLQKLINAPDWYLAHEYLGSEQNPICFSNIIKDAESVKLNYLGDLDLTVISNSQLQDDYLSAYLSKDFKSLINTEQNLDELVNRKFRRSIFVKNPIREDEFSKRLEEMFFYSHNINHGQENGHHKIQIGDRGYLYIKDTLSVKLLSILAEAKNQGLSLESLSIQLAEPKQSLCEVLIQLIMKGAVQIDYENFGKISENYCKFNAYEVMQRDWLTTYDHRKLETSNIERAIFALLPNINSSSQLFEMLRSVKLNFDSSSKEISFRNLSEEQFNEYYQTAMNRYAGLI